MAVLAAFALLAATQSAKPPAAPSAGPPAELPAEPPVATLVYFPRENRMTVPVRIDARGPFDFVVDTGAQRSVVAAEVAAKLALPAGAPVRLVSMSGINRVPTVRVGSLAAGPLRGTPLETPVLAKDDLDADGMLGVDALKHYALGLDFVRHTMTVRPAAQRRERLAADEDEVVVTARSRFGQLVVTEAYYRGQRIRIVIDTGSSVTMGNAALRRLVGQRQDTVPIRMRDVVGAEVSGDYTQIAAVRVGEITFRDLPVAFADIQPFRTFRLDRQPALLLGMDALGLFRRVEIDFANRQIRFVRVRDSRDPALTMPAEQLPVPMR